MTAQETPFARRESGFVGGIPVRNIWLLMLYASDLLRTLGAEKTSLERNPDDIPDLVAEQLARLVEKRMRRNLTFGYRERDAVLGRVRGRVLMLETECGRLLSRGKVACRFDELTVDTLRNRYVRSALDSIAELVRRRELTRRCRSLATDFRRLGVAGERPTRAEMSSDRIGRNDSADRLMMATARLAFDLALPTEFEGNECLPFPDREIGWFRRLYEKAVGGLYDAALTPYGWRVETGRRFDWQTDGRTSRIAEILPSMRTDIVLEHPESGHRIVIDTKFNALLTKGWYREESLRSGYVYQIYAYLRSQEKRGDALAENASGILLHPAVGGNRIDETVLIQGHAIRFATVELSASGPEIRRQLLDIANVPSAGICCGQG